MGENKGIKNYNYHHAGENLELFATTNGKMSVAEAILKSQWVTTAADLGKSKIASASSGKFYDQEITVLYSEHLRRPLQFFWRRKFYKVDAVIGVWVLESCWWDAAKKQSRRYFRVLARGGTYDIYLDHLQEAWFLESVSD